MLRARLAASERERDEQSVRRECAVDSLRIVVEERNGLREKLAAAEAKLAVAVEALREISELTPIPVSTAREALARIRGEDPR